ncbi:MAG: hypothetical protein AB1591_10045 [Pseudomonadota bacterium]
MNSFSQLSASFPLMLSLGLFAPAQAAEPETLTNREGAVTVKVTPRNISPNAGSWDFEVSLNTHSVALDQDMAHAAVLMADSGKPQAPLGWYGDPPGGHHRKGVLKFQPSSAFPQTLVLHIDGVGGVKRIFRWRLK